MKLPRLDARTIDRLVTLAAFLFAAVTIWLLSGCNGQLAGAPYRAPSLAAVVKNNDTLPVTVELSWWTGSTIAGVSTRTIPAGGTAGFTFATFPDGFEIKADPAWMQGVVLQSTDYAGCQYILVNYPQATSERRP